MNGDKKSFSPLSAWGFAFGCIIGWGAFVMPGTTFLPEAGVIGTVIGLLISTAAVLIICACYLCLLKQHNGEPGTYAIIRGILGEDHAFLAVWSLGMAYISLLWANATAFSLLGRYFFGNILKFGFHYTVAGYDVYGGEVLFTVIIVLFFGLLTAYAKKAADFLRTVFAIVLFVSVTVLFVSVVGKYGFNISGKGFADIEVNHIVQILNIAVLCPWMFVGFEVVTGERNARSASAKRISLITVSAILAGMAVYIMLALTAGIDVNPVSGDDKDMLLAMPVFYNIKTALGDGGFLLLGIAVSCTLATSVLGFYAAGERIINTMVGGDLLPKALAGEKDGISRRAVLGLMVMSLPVAFLGRTAVGWNADVSTLAVSIVYVYISVCTFISARRSHKSGEMALGIIGTVVFSFIFLFLLVPNIFSENGLATETYLMLGVWSLLGTLYYWFVFRRDGKHRFGKSTIMWIMMLFLLFFSTNVWLRLYEQDRIVAITQSKSGAISSLLTGGSLIQMMIVVLALLILFSLFTTMVKREKEIEKDKANAELERNKAEESSKAKSVFLSNMSHDIRTPMNAIIGYINLSKQSGVHEKELRDYMSKIETSSHHLLALINDVLEMSRIESGRMDLEPIPIDLVKTLYEVKDMFSTQMDEKSIEFSVDASQVKRGLVYCDKNRLNRVLLNLLSNAYKFTPEGGRVTVSLWQIDDGDAENGSYELRVADSGIGMTKEFADRVFDAFERERTSTVSGIEGTGLGMAITKSIIDLMGGTIEVNTAPNAGTEFVIRVKFKLQEESIVEAEDDGKSGSGDALDFSEMRLLLVEDMAINREIAKALLTNAGFSVETAENGKEAVDKVAASGHGYYDAVLMDIQMPVMDGYEATETIRGLSDKELSQIPIIAMTANAFSEDVKRAHDVGMNGHIAKPIDVDNMLGTIREVLG